LLRQQLQARFFWIVSPCPEWVDWMWTSVRGGDGRDGDSNGKDGCNDGRDDGGSGLY
jgi:hypothetical protein